MEKYNIKYNDPSRGGMPTVEWGRKWVNMIVSKASEEISLAVQGKNFDYSEPE
jgi:hypothetical protein